MIATHPATGLELSLHAAAVNAVMAGCLPEYFPVVVAAFEAMDRPDFNFHGSTASTGGSAPLLIVSGAYADEIGMNADVNLFGPGNRANATIGRAVRLILRNVFQMLPGISDKSTQGNPGKYSFCIAERARGNPWPLLCEAQGYAKGVSSVTVFAGGGFCNVENHGGNTPEQVLGSVADAMANYGCITLGQSVVILAPEHMQHRRRRRLDARGRAGLPVQPRQAFGRGHEGRRQVPRPRVRQRSTASGAHALAEPGFVHRGHRARRYPDHDGRRRCRRPFVLHSVVEPRPRLDHAARAIGVRSTEAVKEEPSRMQLYAPPRPRRSARRSAPRPSPAWTACGSASWRTASSTPRRC